MTLTSDQALGIFRMRMPGVTVLPVPHEDYIRQSAQHPMIAAQVRAGVYEDLDTEFLSVARTHARLRTTEVDLDLIVGHMKGVDDAAAFGYVASVALHEYHHVEYHQDPAGSHEEQYQRELECDAYLRENYPEIMSLAAQAEAQSITIQRVYRRLAERT